MARDQDLCAPGAVESQSLPTVNQQYLDFYGRRGRRNHEALAAARQRDYGPDPPSPSKFGNYIVEHYRPDKSLGRTNTMPPSDGSEPQTHFFFNEWGILSVAPKCNESWWVKQPEILPLGDPKYLCGMCRHINFDILFASDSTTRYASKRPIQISLYALPHMVRQHQCAFCSLVVRRIQTDQTIDLNDLDLLDVTMITLATIRQGPNFGSRVRIEVDWNDGSKYYFLHKVTNGRGHHLDGVRIDVARADMRILKSWLGACYANQRSHAGQAQDSFKNDAKSLIRVIDTQDRKICEINSTSYYACLSYVWGGVQQARNTMDIRSLLERPGGLSDPSIHLPRTITDAIEVANQSGIRYLWIDSLCIEHDNSRDKHQSIANMAHIYRNAQFTIVASSNLSPNDGLPGVTRARTRPQLRAILGGTEVSFTLHDKQYGLNDIVDSKWNTRGWTYQERILSPRLLYFTESQMIFECGTTHMFEDTVPPSAHKCAPVPDVHHDANSKDYLMPGSARNDQLPVMEQEKFCSMHEYFISTAMANPSFDDMVCQIINENLFYPQSLRAKCGHIHPGQLLGPFVHPSQSVWELYVSHATRFSALDLTYPKDVLHAFHGITKHLLGDIYTRFEYNLPLDFLDRALLWYHPTASRRRQGSFPSWSWAGWYGRIQYPSRGWHNAFAFKPVSVALWCRRLQIKEGLNLIDQTLSRDHPWSREEKQKLEERFRQGKCNDYFIPKSHRNVMLAKVMSDLWCNVWISNLGWRVWFDTNTNQAMYEHDQYPGKVFEEPIPLPGETTHVLPDEKAALHFYAPVAPVKFCDMRVMKHVRKASQEPFLQIGLHDEVRSINKRAPSKRIIYHQGYRAGCLTLDSPMEDLDLSSTSYRLVALSRDAPPWNPDTDEHQFYVNFVLPTMSHDKVQYEDEIWFGKVFPPEETVDPHPDRVREDGEPHWDPKRFLNGHYPIYNVLLVQKTGQYMVRLGIGKMHWHAFHHAGGGQREFGELR